MSVEMTDWIFLFMGIFLLIVGIVIWAGKKLSIVHAEQASKVSDEDVKPYSRILGIGVILMGVGVALYGALGIIEGIPSFFNYASLIVFEGVGFLLCYIGQKKYFKGDI